MRSYNILFTGLTLLFASSFLVPLFSKFINKGRKIAGALNFLFCLAAGLCFLCVAFGILFSPAVDLETQLGIATGGSPQLGFASQWFDFGFAKIYFLLDGVSAFFVIIISIMAAVSAYYSIEYMNHYSEYSLQTFLINYPLFIAGMLGLVITDDLSTGFTLSWQLMTISSFFLIRYEYKNPQIRKNAFKYLYLMELAWLLIVLGASLIPGAEIGASIHELTIQLATMSPTLQTLSLALILVGFAFKAGVFPFGQMWLPDAHSVAPSPVSAVLSGVMIKTGAYGILRTLFWMIPNGKGEQAFDQTPAQLFAFGVAIFGVLTLFIGTLQALKQNDSKRLHAYSSIGQMGYIILAIGTARYFMEQPGMQNLALLALLGGAYHILNHSFFKGLLFLSTGSVQYATGTKDLNLLGGLIKPMPITAIFAGIAAASVAGVPGFSGFVSKWAIIAAGFLASDKTPLFTLFAILGLMTGAVTLALYIKFFGMTFTSSGYEWNPKKHNLEVKEVPYGMLAPKALLATLCIVLGLFPGMVYEMLEKVFVRTEGSGLNALFDSATLPKSLMQPQFGVHLDGTAMLMPLVLVIIIGLAYGFALWLRRAGASSDKTAAVWLCGYQDLNNQNRIRSSGLYGDFKNFTKWTGGNPK